MGGETAAANNGGRTNVTDTFLNSFWYADQLGQLASTGVKVFQRQVLIAEGGYPLINANADGSFTPLPDFWLALLFRRIMGTRVLSAAPAAGSKSLRAYCHCAAGGGGGVALLLINLGADTLNVSAAVASGQALTAAREEWVLGAGDQPVGADSRLQTRQVTLNGAPLAVLPGPALPAMEGRRVQGGGLSF